MTPAAERLLSLVESLTPSGEIGDGMVAELHDAAAKTRAELCRHSGNLNAGPRIPLRWGSAATLICQVCGKWRQERTPNGPWQTQAELEEALAKEEPA